VLAVGEEFRQPLGEGGSGVVDVVAEDVEFARRGGAVVDCGDLDRGDDSYAEALPGGERLRDPADRVVVGEGQQLDAGVGRAGYDLGGG
jgi:hypothetical protein